MHIKNMIKTTIIGFYRASWYFGPPHFNRLFSCLPSSLYKFSKKIIRRWDISSIDKLVFNEDTAIVVVPHLDFIWDVRMGCGEKLGDFENPILRSDFYKDIGKIVGDLPIGNYSFYLHIYTEYYGVFRNSIFNFDPDNKKILNEMRYYDGYMLYSEANLVKEFTSYENLVYNFCLDLLYGIYNKKTEERVWASKIKKTYFNKESVIFIKKNFSENHKRKLINSSMNIYRDYKKHKDCKWSFYVNKVILPVNPVAIYNSVCAVVFKDRNPIGKFKPRPGNGFVIVIISLDEICKDFGKESADSIRNTEIRLAFITFLDINVLYTVSIVVRKGKHNVTLIHTKETFVKDQIEKDFDKLFRCLRGILLKFLREDINRYRERLFNINYVKIIFKPLSDRNIDPEVKRPLIKYIKNKDLTKKGSVNPRIPKDNSDGYLVEKNFDLSLKKANTSLPTPTRYKEKLEYNKDLRENVTFRKKLNLNLVVFKSENLAILPFIEKEKIAEEFLTKGLEKASYLRMNKRLYSTYINIIEKRLFSSFCRGLAVTGNSAKSAKSLVSDEEILVFDPLTSSPALPGGEGVWNKSIKKTKIVMENQLFNIIKDILSTSPINHDTQLKIEKLIFNDFNDYFADSENIIKIFGVLNSKLLSNKDFKAFIHKSLENIKILFKEFKTSLNKSSNNKAPKTRDKILLFKTILSYLLIKDLMSIIIMCFFKVITYNMVKKEDKSGEPFYQSNLLNLSIELGEKLVGFYLRTLYKKASLDIKLTEFKEKLLADPSHNILYDKEFLVYIGTCIIQLMKEGGLVEDKIVKIDIKKNHNILIVSPEVLKILGKDIVNKPIAIPFNLPMIVKPKAYKNLKGLSDGGYLLNNKEIIHPLFTENLLQTEKSTILKDNKILESINGIMQTAFKINTQLLDYILNIPGFLPEEIDPPYSNLKKRNKVQESEYQKWVSEKLLNDFIITMANTYRDIPEIFFPIILDFRGRLYSRVSYLNYQGSELAKSLLLFARPGLIKRNNLVAIDYLKSYGAVCFGHGLDKKSYIKRIQWVDKHWEDITGLNNDFILTADNKFGFLAFCLEMQRFDSFYNTELTKTFKTYLPIQLDATCNGFQHLALLSDEVNLFDMLNLSVAKKDDDPKDFYTFILNKIKAHLLQTLLKPDLKNRESIMRLLHLDLKRSNIKPLVMTKPYNATTFALSTYLAKSLVYRGYGELEKLDNKTILKPEAKQYNKNLSSDNTNEDYTEFFKYVQDKANQKKLSSKAKNDSNRTSSPQKGYFYSSSETSSDFVSRSDIYLYVETFNSLLFNEFPHIKNLMLYLERIVEILYDLNLPVLWRLPHGLQVCQRYSKEKIKKIKPYFFSSKELSLTLTDKTQINLTKQKNALMPNLVHSLDAASMILLYYYLKKESKLNYINFYSVHDCFAVTADKVELLIVLIRNIYIDIYSDNKYIERFDKDVIENIKIHLGEGKVKYVEDTREMMIVDINKIIKLPDIPLNPLDVKIKKAQYKKLSKALLLIN